MSRSSFGTHLSVYAVLLGLLLLVGCATVSSPTTAAAKATRTAPAVDLSGAWNALWSDQFSAAETTFRDALKSSPSSAEAARGLGLALYARGAIFEAADSLIASISSEPDDVIQLAVRSFVADLIPYRGATDAKLKDIDKAFEGATRPLWVQRVGFRDDLARATDIAGDVTQSAQLAAHLGVVTGWRLLGPYLSISGSGFETPFIDEKDLRMAVAKDPVALGVSNLPLHWIAPADAAPGGTVDLSQRFNMSGSSCYYASTQISIPDDGEYWFVLDRSGAVRIWIDGAILLTDPRDRAGNEMNWSRSTLRKGDHLAVIKIADDRRGASFRLFVQRATEPAGTDTAVQGYLAERHGLTAPEASPILARLSVRAKESGRVEDLFWLAWSLNKTGYAEAALQQMVKARANLPAAAFSYARLIESRSSSLLGRSDEARNAMEGPPGEKPSFAPSSDFLIDEALSGGRIAEAGRLLDDSQSVFGARYGADLYQALLAARTGNDVYSRIAAFHKTYPDVPQLTLDLLDGEWDGISSDRVLYDAIKENLPAIADASIARGLFGRREWKSASSRAHRAASLWPESDFLQVLAFAASGQAGESTPAAARDRLDALMRDFPRSLKVRDAAVWLAGGEVAALEVPPSAGTADQAKDLASEKQRLANLIASRLELNPADFASRERIRTLKGEASLDSLATLSDPLAVIAEYAQRGHSSSGDVVRVIDENVEMFFGDGGHHISRQIVYKILSRTGVRLVSSQDLNYNPSRDESTISRAFVLKADGTRIAAKSADGRVSFPGIEPGDCTVLAYTVNGADTGSFRGQFWTSIVLNSRFPTYRASWNLIYPAALFPKVVYHNAENVKTKETQKSPAQGLSEISISATDTDGVQISAAPTDWRDTLAWVDISSITDWQQIVDWYTLLASGRCVPTSRIDAKVHELTTHVDGRDQIIATLYDYVSNKIDYEDLSFQYSAYVPQRPETVMRDGYGDCKDKSTLLVSMLRSAGIDARLALSEPSYAGANTFLPSPRFSHAIVLVPGAGAGGADLLLDPTSAYFTYPDLPPALIGTWYLPITPSGAASPASLVRIGKGEPTGTGIVIELQAATGEWRVRGDAVFRGIHAAQVRDILDSGDLETQRMSFALFVAEGLSGFRLDRFDAKNVEGILASPVVSFGGTVPSAIVKGGSSDTLSLPWFVSLPAGLLDEVRSAPKDTALLIDVPQLQTPQHQSFVVELPDGYQVAALPAESRMTFGDAYAVFRFTKSGTKILAEREIFLPRMSVSAADFAALDSFLAGVAAHQLETVTLIPSGGK